MEFTGTKLKTLGTVRLPYTVCRNCNVKGTTDLVVSANYFHMLWIPTLSLGKSGTMECQSCQIETEQDDFPEEVKQEYKKIKSGYKAPWYHSLLSIVLAALIGLSFLFSVTGIKETDPREAMYNSDLEVKAKQRMQPGDALAEVFLAFVTKSIPAKADPASVSCYTKANGEKVLLLVTVPSYRILSEDEQSELRGVIDEFISKNEQLKEQEVYLGVYGMMNLLKYFKTPAEEGEEGGYLGALALYEFYGNKPAKNNP